MKVGLPWWLRLYNICLQCGRPGFDPWAGESVWRRDQLPTLVFWPGEFHRQRILEGYGPRGCKESDLIPGTLDPPFSVQFSSVTQSCPTLCDPMNRSTPGLPVHHQLPEFTQTHVHLVSDAIQPSHPLSSLSPPAPNPSQHQSLFLSQLFA